MKRFIYLFMLVYTFHVKSFSLGGRQNLEVVINQSIELYNSQKYTESMQLLETIKDSRKQYISWYYYYAINLIQLNNYDMAIRNLELFLKNSNIKDSARANYSLGLAQFYKGDYDKALNSLELSLDISTDAQLDKMTDSLIDRVIRYQNYFENNKPTSLSFLFGYNYDSNAINFSPDSFGEKLNGHILNYGVSLSHKFVDRYNFVFEPNLSILDNYTLDNSFKSNSIIQSTDALQFLISAPIRFYFEEEKLTNKFDFSLNLYSVYLPINNTNRELSLTSFFIKGMILTPMSSSYSLRYNTNLAVDKSYGYATDDDDASGLRIDFTTTLIKYLEAESGVNIYFDLGVEAASTKGINTRYKKYSTAMGYSTPSWFGTSSVFRCGYQYLNYSDKVVGRTDNQISLSVNTTKELSGKASIGIVLGSVSNSSNIDLNKYNDVSIGFQYSKLMNF